MSREPIMRDDFKKSSITCIKRQRKVIDSIKETLTKLNGYEPTDKDIVDILLKAYEEKYPYLLSEQLERIVNELSAIIVDAKEIEKLQRENEELRKELEELKKRKTTAVDPSNYEECYQLFLKALSQILEEKLRRGEITDEDVHNGFVTFMELFKDPSKILEGLALLGRASRVFNVKI